MSKYVCVHVFGRTWEQGLYVGKHKSTLLPLVVVFCTLLLAESKSNNMIMNAGITNSC